ncbi:hypothetical protein H0H10_20690 [Streptomyces sp. TRM S81-3]|uniref:Transcription regulator HTH AraC- type ligand binding domain-containing protein n=1 Tax=Streptomyces griseicoloratus TaxID=2752516 RepID=A0A926QS14_9ACTN|nr:hypothetical protein [Streptomyces griseicoloratus]
MLLLDLDTVAPHERVDAFHHALTNDSVPNRILHEETGRIHARMERWRIGGLDLVQTRNSGFTVHRTKPHVSRQRSHPIFSVALQPRGVGRGEVAGRQLTYGPDDILVFHELTPRVYGWSGDGAGQAMMIDVERLGVPVDMVVKASLQLRAGPMHDLVLQHLRGIWRAAERADTRGHRPAVRLRGRVRRPEPPRRLHPVVHAAAAGPRRAGRLRPPDLRRPGGADVLQTPAGLRVQRATPGAGRPWNGTCPMSPPRPASATGPGPTLRARHAARRRS